MINGIKISEIPQIRRNRVTHLQRLEKIKTSTPKKNFLTTSFSKMLQSKRVNHENWKNYQCVKQEEKLNKRNEKIFEKIIYLSTEHSPYKMDDQYKKSIFRHHNSKVNNLKRSSFIQEENPEISKRIHRTSAFLSHNKDLQQFRKTRKLVNRLQKFEVVKRMTNYRSKTQPEKSMREQSKQKSIVIESKNQQ